MDKKVDNLKHVFCRHLKNIRTEQNAVMLVFDILFDYKITFLNLQHTSTNAKGYFVVKNSFKR